VWACGGATDAWMFLCEQTRGSFNNLDVRTPEISGWHVWGPD